MKVEWVGGCADKVVKYLALSVLWRCFDVDVDTLRTKPDWEAYNFPLQRDTTDNSMFLQSQEEEKDAFCFYLCVQLHQKRLCKATVQFLLFNPIQLEVHTASRELQPPISSSQPPTSASQYHLPASSSSFNHLTSSPSSPPPHLHPSAMKGSSMHHPVVDPHDWRSWAIHSYSHATSINQPSRLNYLTLP